MTVLSYCSQTVFLAFCFICTSPKSLQPSIGQDFLISSSFLEKCWHLEIFACAVFFSYKLIDVCCPSEVKCNLLGFAEDESVWKKIFLFLLRWLYLQLQRVSAAHINPHLLCAFLMLSVTGSTHHRHIDSLQNSTTNYSFHQTTKSVKVWSPK